MKIMRMRVNAGLYLTFMPSQEAKNVTRKMIEDKEFLKECVDHNLSFLKSIPNSVQYWMHRKKNVFSMMRQLGKPTIFLTLSAREIQWPKLIRTLYKLKYGEEYDPNKDPLELNSCPITMYLSK